MERAPEKLLEAQHEVRHLLGNPTRQILSHLMLPRMDGVRQKLGEIFCTSPNNLGLIPNATQGVNDITHLSPKTGDEILINNHGYNACNNAALFHAQKQGATIQVANIPFPIQSCSSR